MTRPTSLALVAASLLLCAACRTAEAPSAPAPPAGAISQRSKEQSVELGRQYKTAWALYQALKAEARGGQRPTAALMPDWGGVYSRPADKNFTFDPDQPPGVLTTAKLTPEYQAKLEKRVEDVKKGIEWDPISTCAPPGYPRWLTEPFLREFVPTPNQTWLINEMVNDVRRVYTDGRDHVAAEDRYPLYDGDSIGFWDGQKLVVHTNQLQAGMYQRANPDYSDQVETVEIWQKADDKTVTADVWVYDPPSLVEPWYVKQSYVMLADPDRALRVRYWNCAENQNNAVHQTQSGSTQFNGFSFDPGAKK
jgi:hypothetical protein